MFYMCFFILKNEWFAHSLFFNEWCEQITQVAHQKWASWANSSGRSPKMSDHEQFAQAAHQKWATMSKSLRSLIKNEQMSESLFLLSESLIRSFFHKKLAIRSENRWANSQPWQLFTTFSPNTPWWMAKNGSGHNSWSVTLRAKNVKGRARHEGL